MQWPERKAIHALEVKGGSRSHIHEENSRQRQQKIGETLIRRPAIWSRDEHRPSDPPGCDIRQLQHMRPVSERSRFVRRVFPVSCRHFVIVVAWLVFVCRGLQNLCRTLNRNPCRENAAVVTRQTKAASTRRENSDGVPGLLHIRADKRKGWHGREPIFGGFGCPKPPILACSRP